MTALVSLPSRVLFVVGDMAEPSAHLPLAC